MYQSFKKVCIGAVMLLGLAAGSANAVTITTGDTVRVDYFLSGTAFDPDANAVFFVALASFGVHDSFLVSFYDHQIGLYAQGPSSGPASGVVVNYFGFGLPDYYFLLPT
jgi:hypothetical protein